MAEVFVFSIIILLLSVIIHEVAHGLAARYFGDTTAQKAGRLTLNPIPHIDPVGTILVPLISMFSQTGIIIGWAKPVPVNPLNFSNLRMGEFLVSAAGVGSNFLLAILAAILYHILNPVLGFNSIFIQLFIFMVKINLLLGIFNLLPIHPLDGSKILMSQLPYKLAKEYEKITPYGLLIILILWFVPIGGGSLLWFLLGTGVNLINFFLRVPLF